MAKVCELQKAYGKTAKELKTLIEGFLWVLDGYAIQDILSALRDYIRTHNDIPAPADLVAIIDPPEPKLDRDVYREIMKRRKDGSVFVSQDEKNYCHAYERQEIAKARY